MEDAATATPTSRPKHYSTAESKLPRSRHSPMTMRNFWYSWTPFCSAMSNRAGIASMPDANCAEKASKDELKSDMQSSALACTASQSIEPQIDEKALWRKMELNSINCATTMGSNIAEIDVHV